VICKTVSFQTDFIRVQARTTDYTVDVFNAKFI